MHRNESYSVHQLDNHVHNVATSPTQNYSSLGPYYNVITSNVDTYDTIDRSQQSIYTPQANPTNPTPVRDEASKRGDDFYDAEQHTYSVVNVKHKKRAKKTSEDGEGKREEPPDYEMAVPGETS